MPSVFAGEPHSGDTGPAVLPEPAERLHSDIYSPRAVLGRQIVLAPIGEVQIPAGVLGHDHRGHRDRAIGIRGPTGRRQQIGWGTSAILGPECCSKRGGRYGTNRRHYPGSVRGTKGGSGPGPKAAGPEPRALTSGTETPESQSSRTDRSQARAPQTIRPTAQCLRPTSRRSRPGSGARAVDRAGTTA